MPLPQELIDAIIDILEDDVQSLLKCTSVSSAFLTRAQKHLFRQVALSTSNASLPARLTALLSESPHISRAISSLRIVEEKRKRCKKSLSWLQSLTSLSDALPKLTSVRELSLETADWFSWSSVPSTTQSAFQSLFASGTLVRLSLDSIADFPRQLLECAPTLQELHLENASFDIPSHVELESYHPSHQKSKLTHLYISGHVFEPIEPFLKWILSPNCCLDMSGLRHLSLLIPYDCGDRLADQVLAINKLVQLSSQSLRELHVIPSLGDLDNLDPVSKIPLNLPDLPQLHTLHLPLEISDYELPETNPNFVWSKALLGAIPTSTLERLDVIHMKCNLVQGNPIMAFDASYWEDINRILTVPSLRSLRHVNLALQPVYMEGPDKYVELVGLVEQAMKVLNEKEILSVEIIPVTSTKDLY